MVAVVESASAGVSAPMLELRGINAAYGPFRAILDVSFAVQPGRVLPLPCSHGHVKTTTAPPCSRPAVPTAAPRSAARAGGRGLRRAVLAGRSARCPPRVRRRQVCRSLNERAAAVPHRRVA